MKIRAVIAFIIVLVILTAPFIVNAAYGDMFQGAPQPHLGSASNQYGLRARPLAGAITVPSDIMNRHMVNIQTINEQYGGTQNCLKCHTREDFCDTCHGYAGIRPNI